MALRRDLEVARLHRVVAQGPHRVHHISLLGEENVPGAPRSIQVSGQQCQELEMVPEP